MYYVATHKGFLCKKDGRFRIEVDLRVATPFLSYEEADEAGKAAVRELEKYLRGAEHYAILKPSIGCPAPAK